MLHPAFRRLAKPQTRPSVGPAVWLASRTATSVQFELALDHPVDTEARRSRWLSRAETSLVTRAARTPTAITHNGH